MQTNPIVYKVPEAARLLGLGRSTVYKLILSGELPSFKVGKSRRLAYQDIQDLLNRLRAESKRGAGANG